MENQTVKLRVDGREITAEAEKSLLRVCLDNGIYIPNLCDVEGKTPPASCRMCFVEIEGQDRPSAACTVSAGEAMVVRTDTPAVRRLQRAAFRLLLSVHDVDCRNCPANKSCELQRIARFLNVGLKLKHLETYLKPPDTLQKHPFLEFHPNRCVLCGRCIHICRNRHGQSTLTFAKRGFDTVISAYGEDDARKLGCMTCAACVDSCPVAAITLKKSPASL
jgi:NADH dehydrogenase/NADH:ubiquinone oxidoreductase subunit G